MLSSMMLLASMAFTTGQSVNADSTSNSVVSPKEQKTTLSQEQIDEFDQFVTVNNNQYILSSRANNIFSSEDVKTVKEMLNTSNQEIKSNNELIDPESKEIIARDNSPFIVMAAYNKNYTTKAFWWGKRYYFTSNIAVSRGAKYFRHIASLRNDQSLFLSALGDSIAYASPYATLAANVASMGVSYVAGQYNGAASALVSYNNRHRHNQIYLDMNRTFQYSLHILK